MREKFTHLIISVQFIYLPLRITGIEAKKKKIQLFRLSWRGSPKEASGLIENGLPQINN